MAAAVDSETAEVLVPSSALTISPAAGIARQVLRLATPVFVEQVLHLLVGFTDTLLTGRYLSKEHLAAVTQASYLMWLVTGLFVTISAGSTALVARFVGAQQPADARHVTNQSLTAGIGLSLAAMAAALTLAPYVIAILQLQGSAAGFAVRYLYWVLPVMPLIMVEVVGIACLHGAGDTVGPMWVMAGVNTVNVLLSWGLVQGWGPLPQLGWDGIALGTAAGHLFGGLAIAALLLRGRAGLHVRPAAMRPDFAVIRRILRVSLPAGGDVLTIIFCQLAFVAVINRLGTEATAAHGVAIRAEAIAFLSGEAFAVAAATLVGQSLGAGDPRRAARSAWTACGIATATMSAMGLVFVIIPRTLVGLFVRDESAPVADLAAPVLQLIAWAMPLLAALIILTRSLRGAGDTRWPWLFTLIGFLAVRLPTAWILGHAMGLGLYGAWLAMFADISVRSVLVLARFLHGGWKHARV